MTSARRDFGSFHSSNVQELLGAIKAGNYVPPTLPFELPKFHYNNGNIPSFGEEMRKKHFLLEEKWQLYIERQPLRFYDRELLPHLVFILKRLATFVGCSPMDLVLVPNVTMAMNIIVRNQDLKEGDIVYMLNVTYGAVKKLLRHVCEEQGATLQEESLEFPLSGPGQIINKVEESLQPGTKLAVFDHIPSNAAFINPLEAIISICRQRGTRLLIDGAHSLGVMDLKLSSLDVDYYTSNCHKWFCSPKGCAFLYVKPELQNSLRPLVISHGFGFGFSSDYIWTGLKDYTPPLALHTVLDFWESVGVQRIRGYIKDLMSQAVDLLVNRWKTGLLAQRGMFGSMACVRLPERLLKGDYANYEQAETIQNILYSQFNIEVPIKALGGKLYVRISVHIYNDLKQYQKLADAVEEITLKACCLLHTD
ncbi:uncharacterized protein LOC134342520 isoform X2 [Mobula hypostoma]|uniref:uncharacterized protein LOC134342520 isoform X2 n=1 Tax=Mobula hypostoma TaxID=723540 RepID=UPI002FC39C07